MNKAELLKEAKANPTLNRRAFVFATSDGSFYPDIDKSRVDEIAEAGKLEIFELNLQEPEQKAAPSNPVKNLSNE